MYEDHLSLVQNASQGNTIKKEIKVDNQQYSLNQGWPEWLPQDWCIHRNIDDLGAPSNVYYSNPKGKRFYSKKEVFQHIASHRSHNKINTQIRLKAMKVKGKPEENKLSTKENSSTQMNSPPKWPEWLPQDWCIKRSYDDPCDVYYYSPEWKKFRCKDEVIKHIVAQSVKPKFKPKPKPKQIIRRRRRVLGAEDDQVFGGTRLRKDKNNVTS